MALKDILESIQHPHRVTFEAKDMTDTKGKFIAYPFEKGYATTVGVALRRVLLSSIPGYAISAIKIEGVTNEFENVPSVKEDTIVMIMHLKSVIVALPEHVETKTIHIKKVGPCNFTAKDIEDADVEIKVYNPEHHIATISEGATFEIDLQIECGYGYIPAEMNSDLFEDVSAIAIDAVYSPIVRVNYDVTDIRVGKRIDYGKLTLEIETKGNIRPDKALSYAAKILRDNLASFLLPEEQSDGELIIDTDSKSNVLEMLKNKSVEEVEFSVRTANFLMACDIKTLDKLVLKSESDILRLVGVNEKILGEIKDKLAEYDVHLGMRP